MKENAEKAEFREVCYFTKSRRRNRRELYHGGFLKRLHILANQFELFSLVFQGRMHIIVQSHLNAGMS